LDLSQTACRRSRRDPTDLTGDLPRAQAAVQEAYLSTLDNSESWDFLQVEGQFTVSSAADTYTWSSIGSAMGITSGTIADILALANDTIDTPLLKPVSWDEMESIAASTQDADPTGCPVYWTKWGQSTIRLYPKPDQTYTLGAFVRINPAQLVNDSDVPLIPYAWRHRLLVPYAAANLLFEEGGFAAMYEAQTQRSLYQQELQQFLIAHGRARGPTLGLVSATFSSDLPGGSTIAPDDFSGPWAA
jgi:hypothetical protein